MFIRRTVLCFSLVLVLGACGGDDTTLSSDAGVDTVSSADGGSDPDDSSGSTGVTCFGPGGCTEGEVCTTEYGVCDCDGAGTGAADMACCGTCVPAPCADKACGDYCDCPDGVACTEIARACNSDGACVTAVGDLGCEEPAPYDPCDGALCGSDCSPCAPDDEECRARPSLPHWCDAEGQCTDGVGEPPVCDETCMGATDCGEGEVCTTDFGDCVACGSGSESEPVCCGVCADNPCAGLACGDSCDCPSGVPCTEIARSCNSAGNCVTANNELGCEEPAPYDPCADLPCGSNCSPCAPDDQACQETPMLEHWCDAEGQCTDGVDNEPPVCEASCLTSSECGTDEVCTTEFGDCIACPGSESESVCCGTCAPSPCAGKVCSDVCTCPDGIGCPDVPMACNSEGHCVSEPDGFECIGPFCEGKECGTPCGPAHVCDPTGACIFNTTNSVAELCAVEAGDCTSSADCENGEACTTLYDACLPCADSPMLTVCCGTCEPFDPCAGLACGDSCSTCPSDQPECPLPAITVEFYCDAEGLCDGANPTCPE